MFFMLSIIVTKEKQAFPRAQCFNVSHFPLLFCSLQRKQFCGKVQKQMLKIKLIMLKKKISPTMFPLIPVLSKT